MDSLEKVRLEALYFCAPGLFALNGDKIESSELLPDTLEAGVKPTREEFHHSTVLPSSQLGEIPNCFGSSPQQHTLPWHFYPGSEELSEALQYRFSDGKVVSAREILYHPNSVAVPHELLPTLNLIKPEVNNSTWVNLIPGSEQALFGSLRKAELTLISILLQAPVLLKKGGPRIWLTDSQNRDETRRGLELKQIAMVSDLLACWELVPQGNWDSHELIGEATLTFVEKTQTPAGKILKGIELDPQQNSLFFHPYSRIVGAAAQALPEDSKDAESRDLNSSVIQYRIQQHSVIQEQVEKVDLKLKASHFPEVTRPTVREVPAPEIENLLWINSEGHIKFCRKLQLDGETLQIWNLPPHVTTWIDGLNGGLGATSEKENRSLAQGRRGLKRDRDLKILKHTGFFALILLETCTFILKKTSFTGKPLAGYPEFFQQLMDRLGTLLHELERKAGFISLSPALPLDKLCSKNLVDLIQTYTQNLIQEAEQGKDTVFTKMGEVRLAGSERTLIRIFQPILASIALESRGQCFLKPRLNAFSNFLGTKDNTKDKVKIQAKSLAIQRSAPDAALEHAIQTYPAASNWLSSSALLRSILPLQKKRFSLFYNELPLDEMSALDFMPEFNLVEGSNSVEPIEGGGKAQTEGLPGAQEDGQSDAKSIDWFELHPKFFFKGVEIESSQLERLSKDGVLEFQGKVYLIQDKNLPSIKRLENFWAKIQSSKSTVLKRKTEETFLRLPKHQTLELLALRSSGVVVRGGEHWKKVCAFYDLLDQPRDPLEIPESIKTELKPYQKSGVRWLLDLYDLGLGGILADDMGLGKTIQTLSFLEILHIRKEMGHVLIVVPTSLTYNWISESAKFTPSIPIQIFQSKMKPQISQFLQDNKNGILICTYGLFTEHQEFFESEKWNVLAFDEAQNLKNISAKRTTVSRKISAKFKVCLTGTPLENHLGEFYSLLDLVVSGSLGELSDFREKFVSPETINGEDLKFLKLKSKPLILRRTKKEILSELPAKIESTIKLPFELKQERIYRDIALSWNEKVKESIMVDGESKSQLMMLTALLRLRQACSDPGSIPNVKYSESPPKINVLLEALEEITESGESALVFTQFLHTFDRIKKEMIAKNISSFSLHGGTSRPERERILGEFQASPKGSVLLMTLKSGGVGLNLVKASYVFHLEPWWNPAVENQATDRAHRIGQQKPVQVYRYLMRESVEEKIEILKERKSARFNALFSSSEVEGNVATGGALLSQADFEYLLS